MSVGRKLFIALLVVLVAAFSGVLYALQLQLRADLSQFEDARQRAAFQPLADALGAAYVSAGGWRPWLADRRAVHALLDAHTRNTDVQPQARPGPPMRMMPLFILDAERRVIFPPRGRGNAPAHEPLPPGQLLLAIKASEDGRPVGWLAVPQREPLADAVVKTLYESQLQAQWWSLAVALLLALALALLMARYLNRRLDGIKQEIRRLAGGDLVARPDRLVLAPDEFGDLAQHLEDLRLALQNTENFRRQWLADSSHELRTPTAAAMAKLEAMLDGIQPIQRDNLQVVHAAIERLATLIDDLNASASAEFHSFNSPREPVDLHQLCSDCVRQMQAWAGARGLDLTFDGPTDIMLPGDSARLHQLLQNLLGNSIKYTDPPGRIQVRLRADNSGVILTVEDSAPGVSAEQLPRLFDHLYRADSSRNRSTGGSGLGLAIARRIVEAHGGSLSASASALGGIKMTMVFGGKTTHET
ncbi:ATP-binding protein [Simiduia agarivorans]|uniref:histidine kinase n=1 Tax=Simiduia agarivorans (strain DSM 21679 / JCM 13881 / BCRC 17597 / SA1) TaxID=1117647 RepID=K4KJF1_SIMAS|nr:ATP-binding protein [Simiduia agarivorans]AFU99259.1 phosphotransferase [Simiduia agarivorans SA1 = DSM 21679]